MPCQDVCLDPDADMRALADALGAVAAGPAATFRLYADDDGRWCVRREGEADDRRFRNRDAALDFLRVSAARCPSHRLVLTAPQHRGSAKHRADCRRQPPPARDRRRRPHRWRRHLAAWLRAIVSIARPT